ARKQARDGVSLRSVGQLALRRPRRHPRLDDRHLGLEPADLARRTDRQVVDVTDDALQLADLAAELLERISPPLCLRGAFSRHGSPLASTRWSERLWRRRGHVVVVAPELGLYARVQRSRPFALPLLGPGPVGSGLDDGGERRELRARGRNCRRTAGLCLVQPANTPERGTGGLQLPRQLTVLP